MALKDSLMIMEYSEFKNEANSKIIGTFMIIGIVSICFPLGMQRG